MRTKTTLLILLAYIICVYSSAISKRDYTKRSYYTIRTVYPNDIQAVEEVARHLGATVEGQVGELKHYYLISTSISDPPIHEQFELYKRSQPLVDQIQHQIPSQRLFKRAPPPVIENTAEEIVANDQILDSPVIENTQEEYQLNGETIPLPSLDEVGGFQKLRNVLNIQDPGFDYQWHLVNQIQKGHDLNVTGVWSQGITGKGVVVAILDDGLDLDHEDLRDNYFAPGSYDFNDHTNEPRPRLSDDTHGTRCAGEIAATKSNVCGVGVAYDAKVAGVRILSGHITEADEAAALNYEYQKNHIYSCSWGPSDQGEVAEAPQGIVLSAIQNGIQNGRNGSGSIFVFASGNGGANEDNCNFDGYTNSLYTITVGAVDRLGNHPAYSELCAAQLVVTYSSGSGGYIYTTDIGNNQCSDRHGGTSAAAPLAAGVFALVLSIRPDLSWRDMQHLCVQSAMPIAPDDPDWVSLPSGRRFNHKFGFGVLDAYQIVELAKNFESVRGQTSVEISSAKQDQEQPFKLDIPDITPIDHTMPVDPSIGFAHTLEVTQDRIDDHGLSRLEHVTVTVNIEHQRRGDLEILLESPHGVVSQLATPRRNDKSSAGLMDWTFMTVKHWEENPVGNWTLRIVDGKHPETTGQFIDWKLTLWGEISEEFSKGEVNTHHISVDDFEHQNDLNNQSLLDNTNTNKTRLPESGNDENSGTSFAIYSLVSVFMIASIVSTSFIVKKYMLSTPHHYSQASGEEEGDYEFDTFLDRHHELDHSDSEDEDTPTIDRN
ncbi:Protease KEX1 [Choanephora cucurbitarum]|uniref:Protease KEX1 n=1 Tax=Choanephora cucurbitarum TaxID=101091 RepID=A0A1C7NKI7_9FUNG|nr:Protease KEX1 [Choanephora cucurbitarum]